MSKVIHKWFWVWDFEKEEKWHNDMSQKGMKLCKVGFCKYTFEECKAGEYRYKLEMLDSDAETDEGKEYIAFLEGTGIEYIGSVFKWSYLRKKTCDKEFELFSTIDSKITHLIRIVNSILAFLCISIVVGR